MKTEAQIEKEISQLKSEKETLKNQISLILQTRTHDGLQEHLRQLTKVDTELLILQWVLKEEGA